jgi:hypothetical protein
LGRAKTATVQVRKAHRPRRRTLKPTRDVERGRLASTVRADESNDLTLGNFEADVAERAQSTEAYRHVLEGERDRSGVGVSHSGPNYSEVRGPKMT